MGLWKKLREEHSNRSEARQIQTNVISKYKKAKESIKILQDNEKISSKIITKDNLKELENKIDEYGATNSKSSNSIHDKKDYINDYASDDNNEIRMLRYLEADFNYYIDKINKHFSNYLDALEQHKEKQQLSFLQQQDKNCDLAINKFDYMKSRFGVTEGFPQVVLANGLKEILNSYKKITIAHKSLEALEPKLYKECLLNLKSKVLDQISEFFDTEKVINDLYDKHLLLLNQEQSLNNSQGTIKVQNINSSNKKFKM